MPPKPPSREEEFELVLGNKQLLSLFFIVVGFFAAFFSVGYMVGFGHGEKAAGTSTIAGIQEPAPKPQEPAALPQTLLQDPPEPPPSVPVAEVSKPSPSQSAAASPEPAPPPPKTTPEPKPKPVQTAPEKKPKPAPAAPRPAAKPVTTAPIANGSGYFLQVAAVRAEADAAELAGQLKAKGYPAAVNTEKADGWKRVVVGPFQSAEAAGAFKAKLSKDGFETMLRKL